MKIFPLKLMSTFDRMSNLVKIIAKSEKKVTFDSNPDVFEKAKTFAVKELDNNISSQVISEVH